MSTNTGRRREHVNDDYEVKESKCL